MKFEKILRVSFLLAVFFLTPVFFFSTAQADENQCSAILRDGLYKYVNMTRSESFDLDMKTYISSSVFNRDFKDGKWGGSLAAVCDGVPISLGLNASEQEVREFQQKVKASSSFSISKEFYLYASSRIPDVELAKVYSDCIGKINAIGLRMDGNVHEEDAVIYIYFRNQVSSDPMAKVTFFDIRGGRNIKNALSKGDILKDVNVITCDRDPNRDLSITIETDRGGLSYYVPKEPIGFNADLPVGTIIASYLKWTEFQEVTKNNQRNKDGNLWSPKYSKWSPADGRDVKYSGFERATGNAALPDLRGRFLRGLNAFDTEYPSISSELGDPQTTRIRGNFQSDELKSHTHRVINNSPPFAYREGGLGVSADRSPPEVQWVKPNISIDATGGPETRPKNVAIYYYIRIN